MDSVAEASSNEHVSRRLHVFLFALLLFFVLGRIRQYWRLKHFPGPSTTGFSGLWHTRAVIGGESPRYYGEICQQYGPIARIAPNHLITSDLDFWTRINAVRSPYKRSSWYYHAARFEPGKDNVFTECDNDRHDARRKKMVAGYSGKENPTLEPSIDQHVRELVDLVRQYASAPSSKTPSTCMDLAEKIPFFTLDVISHVGLGQAFGDLKADQDVNEYIRSSEEGLKIGNTAFALGVAWLKDTPIIGPLISPSEKDENGFGHMMAQVRKIVVSRQQKSTQEKSDMFASFVRHGVAGDDLFQEVFEQILAGSDTTAAAIRTILLYIMSHRRVYAKLQAEIDEAVKSGKAPAAPGIVSDAEVRRLPYLGAVVREGMRMQPPVANIFSRVTPDEGDVAVIGGKEYHIPGGTLIGYSALTMHRNNPSIYGEDCTVFRPERWLIDTTDEAAKERLHKMTRTNDMIFGYGRWLCLGRNIALIEMHKAVFELFRNFDMTLTYPLDPWKTFNSLGLWQISDMWVDVTLRE
ncbi:hypothetical protein yc1106_01025 [Curvularia clavata]|uniref:Cytochrome P450 monooxygenase ABA1 n=1 Tax=Curvularia clavata TaxID=95742 RepID=A0A9Q8Z0F3_CURCL|nr:hypothetical protein yc1106_01025 [Curvularia clavata]